MKLAAALLAFGCLIPALAQGPQEFERSTAAPPAVRDPFVYSLQAPTKKTPDQARIVQHQKPAPEVAHKPTQTNQANQPAPKPAPVAPAVTVTGIVTGPAQTAILSNGGRSYMVRVGDKLGDYRVSAIGPRSVTLATGANSFKLPLE